MTVAKPLRTAACPQCGKPAVESSHPFCSPRCQSLDLHKWLSEGYAIPARELPGDDADDRD